MNIDTIIPLIVVIAVSFIKFLLDIRNKGNKQEQPQSNSPQGSAEKDSDWDWNWEQEVKKIVSQHQPQPISSDEALLAEFYTSDVQTKTKLQTSKRSKRHAIDTPASEIADEQSAYGIGHEGILDSAEGLKRAFIASEILNRKF